MADIVCLGEALIDFVAMEPCSDVGDATGFIRAPGGAPANVAVGAARLGCSSAFLGKVGDDPFGRFLGRTFSDAGVDTCGMVFDPKHRTGLAFVSLAENGERDFCFFRNPSADMTYTSAEVDTAAIDSCRIFHFGSITLVDKAPRAATLSAAYHAHGQGKIVSFDPNLRPPLWRSLYDAQQYMRKGVRAAHIVKVSEEEFWLIVNDCLPEKRLNETEIAHAARYFLKRFNNVWFLVVTRGERGCMWWASGAGSGSHPGFKVKSVDTTGAGDGFVAGFLTGLLHEKLVDNRSLTVTEAPLVRVIDRANAVGAIATTKKGAIPALPTTAELDAFISLHKS